MRAGDAVYPYKGLRTEKFQVGISYDITQSDLRKSNGFTGSSEISFIWFFDQRNKGKIIPCFFLTKDRPQIFMIIMIDADFIKNHNLS